MTLIIDLTPTEEACLTAAAQEVGLAPAELAKKLLTNQLPGLAAKGAEVDPTLALFARWEREDAGMTPEEVAEEERQWKEFKGNLNAERNRAGARRLF